MMLGLHARAGNKMKAT